MWGIGAYWDLVSRAAAQLDASNDVPEFSVSVRELCSFFGCKTNKLETFLDHLQNVCGMFCERSGNVFKIKIPKVLEIRDNHSRNLQVTCKSLASKEVEVEEEVDKKKHRAKGFDQFWEVYPKKRSKGQAEKAWKALKPDSSLLETILFSVRKQKTSKDWKKEV